jgi:hypothetical protein
VAVILGAVAPLAAAHETWLLPKDFTPPAGQSLEFTLTSGMGFPSLGSGVDRRRITEARLIQDGDTQALVPVGGSAGALELSAIPYAGVACAWVNLQPRILEIEADEDVEHYLEEIGAPESIWSAWRESKGTTAWRESYAKLARTYLIGSGEGDPEPCWDESTGTRFDILPMADPTALAPGDTLELQVLLDGEPLAGQSIGLVREGEDPRTLQRSNDAGRVTVTVDGEGEHMIYATNLRRASTDDYAWESNFITLTFLVGGEEP